jgi:membrane-associated phospholipid phosphatase
MPVQPDFPRDLSALGGLPAYLVISGLLVLFTPAAMRLAFAVTLLGALALCFAITGIIRFVWFMPRPKPVAHRNLIEKLDASSFPSLHSMRIAVLCTIVTLLTVATSSALTVTIVVLASLCLLVGVGWMRVASQRHRLVDVIAGEIIGVFVGIAAMLLMVMAPSWF